MLKTLPKFKFLLYIAGLFLVLFFYHLAFTPVQADDNVTVTPTDGRTDDNGKPLLDENTPAVTIEFSGLADGTYRVCLDNNPAECILNNSSDEMLHDVKPTDGKISLTVCGNHKDKVKVKKCGDGDYFWSTNYSVYILANNDDREIESATFFVQHYFPNPISFSPENPTPNDPISFTIGGKRRPADNSDRNTYDCTLYANGGKVFDTGDTPVNCLDTTKKTTITFDPQSAGDYILEVRYGGSQDDNFVLYRITFTIAVGGGSSKINQSTEKSGGVTPPTRFEDTGGAPSIDTFFGSINTDPASIAKALLNLGVGMAGGVAFLLMIFGAYRLIFSAGDPEAIQQGRQVITAAIVGLLVIIFSVFILNLIGISILGLKIGL